jgi:hypothetical protein
MGLKLPLTRRRDPAYDLADLLWRPACRMIGMRSGRCSSVIRASTPLNTARSMAPAQAAIHIRLCSQSIKNRTLAQGKGSSSVSVGVYPAFALANGSLKENAAPRWRFSAHMSPP